MKLSRRIDPTARDRACVLYNLMRRMGCPRWRCIAHLLEAYGVVGA